MARAQWVVRFAIAGSLSVWMACGSSGDTGDDDDDDVSGEADAAPAAQTMTLALGDWQMPAGQEGYYCVRATVPEDIYIQEFRPIAPLGTHHTALAIDQQGGPDQTFPCSANDVGFKLLFGSGVGTEPFALPDGVAFKLEAGTQVMLNLHLYNVGDAMLEGASGIEVRLANPDDVVHEAETVYVMNFDLTVPPGESSHVATCTMSQDATVFGVFPHMHRFGAHMTGTAVYSEAQPVQFFDKPYSFEEQLNHLIEPGLELAAGDKIQAECGFNNTGSDTIGFGDSSDDEMCVLGLYRYPATGGLGLCFN